jgi:hypothetical protein
VAFQLDHNSWHVSQGSLQRLQRTCTPCTGGQLAEPTYSDMQRRSDSECVLYLLDCHGRGVAIPDRLRSAWSADISLSGKLAGRARGCGHPDRLANGLDMEIMSGTSCTGVALKTFRRSGKRHGVRTILPISSG